MILTKGISMRALIIVALISGWTYAEEFWLGSTQERFIGSIENQHFDFDATLKIGYDALNQSSQSHLETTFGISAYYLKYPLGPLKSEIGVEYLLVGIRERNEGWLHTSNNLTILKNQLGYNFTDRFGIFLDSRIISIRNMDLANKDYASNTVSFELMNSEIGIRIKI